MLPLIFLKYDQASKAEHWRVYLSTNVLNNIIIWFHNILGHAEKRSYDFIRVLYNHPQLK